MSTPLSFIIVTAAVVAVIPVAVGWLVIPKARGVHVSCIASLFPSSYICDDEIPILLYPLILHASFLLLPTLLVSSSLSASTFRTRKATYVFSTLPEFAPLSLHQRPCTDVTTLPLSRLSLPPLPCHHSPSLFPSLPEVLGRNVQISLPPVSSIRGAQPCYL